MAAQGLQSLFSQKLDRALFATYFLGAVVPLLALVYGVERYALPQVEDDSLATALIMGISVGIVILSLAAFFALRRLSLNAVTRMDADNDRLAAILNASRELTVAPHLQAAAEVAAGCALRLSLAEVVLVLRRPHADKALELIESAGKRAQQCFQSHAEEIEELAALAISSGRPTPPERVGDGIGVALPMIVDGSVPAAMIVVASGDKAVVRLAQQSVIDALATLSGLAAVALQGAELKDSQRNFFSHATEIMVMALDAHLGERAGGCHRVAQVANRLGRELGLDDEALRQLHFASLLSDIGMLKLSSSQLRSPQHVARHPALGHHLLSRIRLWEPLAEIVLHHHDAHESAGESAGASSPIESRIIHVADTYTAATHGEGSASKATPQAALTTLIIGRGTRFDPDVVAALERIVERGDLDAA